MEVEFMMNIYRGEIDKALQMGSDIRKHAS